MIYVKMNNKSLELEVKIHRKNEFNINIQVHIFELKAATKR